MPLIFAHRGASAYKPENTLAAFALAQQQRADGIELDVQQSADGAIIVFHDTTTERWNGQQRPVSACTVAELQELDIGGERVPTLHEVCDFVGGTALQLNVELKATGIAAATASILREHGVAERTIVSSFSAPALHELRAAAPDLPRAYLMGTRTMRPDVRLREARPFAALRRVAATAWHPSHELPLLAQVLPRVRRAGYAVNVWTVDDPALMRQLITLGATGIITNKPDVAREVMGES